MLEPSNALTSSEIAATEVPGPIVKSNALLYAMVILVVTLATMTAIVVVSVLRPDKDNSSLYVLLGGMAIPTITATLALLKQTEVASAVNYMHLSLNTRLTDFVKQSNLAGRAQGQAEALGQPVPTANPVILPPANK